VAVWVTAHPGHNEGSRRPDVAPFASCLSNDRGGALEHAPA
jgi:hypothetical protein